jgi:hypothetical protein
MDCRGIGCEVLEWIHLTADKFSVAVCCELCCEPSGCRIPRLSALLFNFLRSLFSVCASCFLQSGHFPDSHSVGKLYLVL